MTMKPVSAQDRSGLDMLLAAARQGMPPPDNKGLRYDQGKNRLELIPPEWEWALGEVLTAGAVKYAERNWEKGMDWGKLIGPLRRHLNKFLSGHSYDTEPDAEGRPGTGCHHLALVAWNALALMSYELRGIGTDNLARADYRDKTKGPLP
jgi:hypothetical protein